MLNRLQNSQERAGARPKDIENDQQNIEIYSTLLSIMSTEIIFYPIETILHRIQLQGTRTIIDNLDSGYSVVPILTSYEGATDCYRSTIASEGVSGLYKGMMFVSHTLVWTRKIKSLFIFLVFRFWCNGLAICRTLCCNSTYKMDCDRNYGYCCK